MKILSLGCLHGKVPKKLLKLQNQKFDAVLYAGDYSDGDKLREIEFKIFSKAKNEGNNPKKVIEDFYNNPKNEETIKKELIKSSKSSEIVLKYLAGFNCPVYSVYGNHDKNKSCTKRLNKKYKLNTFKFKSIEKQLKDYNITLINGNKVKIGDFELIGVAGYRLNGESLSTKLSFFIRTYLAFKKANNMNKTIFLVHSPPHGKLDKVNYPSSPMHGKHVGDKFLTKIIKRYQPALYVCAHMHENQGEKKLGKTRIVVTGYGRTGEHAIIEITNGKINIKLN